jgi:hypothetical protein
MQTDGTGRTEICDDIAREIHVLGDWIFYCNWSENGILYYLD